MSNSDEIALATCGRDVRVWDLSRGTRDATPAVKYSPHLDVVHDVRWNHNNLVLASVGADEFVTLVRNSGKLMYRLQDASSTRQEPGESRALAFSSGSRYLVSGGEERKVLVWDLKVRPVRVCVAVSYTCLLCEEKL
jgi:WD40 repeat protein